MANQCRQWLDFVMLAFFQIVNVGVDVDIESGVVLTLTTSDNLGMQGIGMVDDDQRIVESCPLASPGKLGGQVQGAMP